MAKKKEEIDTKKFTNKEISVLIVLGITLLIGVIYLGDVILFQKNNITYLTNVIYAFLLVVFIFTYILVGINACKTKGKPFIILGSLFLMLFSLLNIFNNHGIINIPKQKYIEDFTTKYMTEAKKWASENNIQLEEIYEYSDTFPEYTVIYQSVKAGTLVKDIDKLSITVSDGPDFTKEVLFPSMLGKNVDYVLEFIDNNYFTNVTIDFVENEETRDIVISQDKSGALPRNEAIKITVSLGSLEELEDVQLIDLTNESLFKALTWLKRNAIKYDIEYVYDDSIPKGNIISTDTEVGSMVGKNSTVKLKVSRGAKIVVPSLVGKTEKEVTDWIISNKLKVTYKDEYNAEFDSGKVCKASVNEGDVIESGTSIEIAISKGALKLEEFNSIDELEEWASKYNVKININREFSDTIEAGKIINSSKKAGEVIKEDEEITITVSQGKAYTVPNVVGKTKDEASKACNNAGISCSFVYAYSNNVDNGKVIKQSKTSGSKVTKGAVLTVTISKGKEPVVEKKKYSVYIQQTWAVSGSYSESCNNIKSKLRSATENKVNFVCLENKLATSDGIGLISNNSDIKARNTYTFTEGQTYYIKINS